MATTKVYAPNAAFRGTVAGVAFEDGVGELDPKANAAAHSYFERHGYGLGKRAKPDDERTITPNLSAIERAATSKSPDAREHATSVAVGTPLRDASVDPKREDFLPPVNAGKEDPHGPKVVAPEIHHEGPKGLKPGDVHVDDTGAQEKAEAALATAVLIEGDEHPSQDAGDARGPLAMSDPGSVDAGESTKTPAAEPAVPTPPKARRKRPARYASEKGG